MNLEPLRLNIGCGLRPLPRHVNVDIRDLPGVDVVHDLDLKPWPFEDGCASEIVAIDVFEHLHDVIGAMNECRRILRIGGRLTVRGPLPESPNLWVDVSHQRAFVEHSFDHFDWSTDMGRKYRYGVGPWHIDQVQRDGTNIVFELIKLEHEPLNTIR